MSESDPLDGPATPEEIDIVVERQAIRPLAPHSIAPMSLIELIKQLIKSAPGRSERLPRQSWRRSGQRDDFVGQNDRSDVSAALKRLAQTTPSGVGHGPPGTVCERCSFYGYWMQYPK